MLSVVVIEKNEVHTIEKNIDSLLNQSYRGDYEIIIVDGSSSDGTVDFIKRKYREQLSTSKIKVIVEPGRGFAHARNIGVKNSCGDIIAFTGGNELADHYWLEHLISTFTSVDIVGVYGKMVIRDDFNKNLLKTFCLFKRSKEFHNKTENFQGRGTNMAFRRKVLLAVGLFDEFLCDADDSELAWRVRKIGKIAYNPNAIVFHQRGEWLSLRVFLKYLWFPIKGHAQAVYKNGLFSYHPRVTALYLSPVCYLALLILFYVSGMATLALLASISVVIGFLIISIKDFVIFKKQIALLGVIIYPLQLMVGSGALITGFLKNKKRVCSKQYLEKHQKDDYF